MEEWNNGTVEEWNNGKKQPPNIPRQLRIILKNCNLSLWPNTP